MEKQKIENKLSYKKAFDKIKSELVYNKKNDNIF